MDTETQSLRSRVEAMERRSQSSNDIPPIDPTANVQKLVELESKRQDELRDLAETHRKEISGIREHCEGEVDSLREKLATADSKWRDAADLAESRRVDSLLAAQQQNATLATEKLNNTATTLAKQVADTAEAMRQATAAATKQTADLVEILRTTHDRRLTELEQSRYQIGGRDTQRTENKQMNLWVIGLIASLPAALIALLLLFKP